MKYKKLTPQDIEKMFEVVEWLSGGAGKLVMMGLLTVVSKEPDPDKRVDVGLEMIRKTFTETQSLLGRDWNDPVQMEMLQDFMEETVHNFVKDFNAGKITVETDDSPHRHYPEKCPTCEANGMCPVQTLLRERESQKPDPDNRYPDKCPTCIGRPHCPVWNEEKDKLGVVSCKLSEDEERCTFDIHNLKDETSVEVTIGDQLEPVKQTKSARKDESTSTPGFPGFSAS